MTTKERLHRLIDELPESALADAEWLLQDLRRDAAVAIEEFDEEPLSGEDLAAVRRGLEAIQRGDFVTLEEYERRHQR